jgi:hypothetical protein
MNFKKLYKVLVEDTETLEDKEKRYLGWIVRSIVNQNDAQKAAYNMFIRIFGFDPSKYKDNYIDGFQYFLINPSYNYFSEQQIKEIEKIAGVEFLSRFMGGNERIDMYDFFQNITLRFDLPEEKLIKIMSIVFKVVGERMAKRGHKDWENLLFRKSLDKETEQDWGEIITNL